MRGQIIQARQSATLRRELSRGICAEESTVSKEGNVKAALEEGVQLLASQKRYRTKVRERSLETYKDLKDAHWLLVSVIANALTHPR
jgi:predicted nucleic acid-binding protein